jgi:hypothetical protein
MRSWNCGTRFGSVRWKRSERTAGAQQKKSGGRRLKEVFGRPMADDGRQESGNALRKASGSALWRNSEPSVPLTVAEGGPRMWVSQWPCSCGLSHISFNQKQNTKRGEEGGSDNVMQRSS